MQFNNYKRDPIELTDGSGRRKVTGDLADR